MNFNAYQQQARQTRVPWHCPPLAYLGLELADEAGEVAGKIKKIFRDHEGEVTPEIREQLRAELGDVLWPLSQIADELGLLLAEVAAANIAKLQSRQRRGVIGGSGDER